MFSTVINGFVDTLDIAAGTVTSLLGTALSSTLVAFSTIPAVSFGIANSISTGDPLGQSILGVTNSSPSNGSSSTFGDQLSFVGTNVSNLFTLTPASDIFAA